MITVIGRYYQSCDRYEAYPKPLQINHQAELRENDVVLMEADNVLLTEISEGTMTFSNITTTWHLCHVPSLIDNESNASFDYDYQAFQKLVADDHTAEQALSILGGE